MFAGEDVVPPAANSGSAYGVVATKISRHPGRARATTAGRERMGVFGDVRDEAR
ncbi:hypothetical protein Ga0074812_107238 [Parafrankia irregularis]|uniref:Uncharacterized protein n=1 Tax=Parafrankia irregularis TaxID=795642 RepID=A0A0S4QMW1_9ACTN|nr:hypothetical protein Ga0074812_107238 [Parafrankia irregularis]